MANDTSWMRGSGGVALVFGAVFVLWLLNLFFLPVLVGMRYPQVQCADVLNRNSEEVSGSCESGASTLEFLGAFGDTFGGLNALFTGLALAGVVLSLHRQAELSRRAVKPFVVSQVSKEKGGVRLGQPRTKDAMVCLPVRVATDLSGFGPSPALNVAVTVTLSMPNVNATEYSALPVLENNGAIVDVELLLKGSQVKEFAKELLEGRGVEMSLGVAYESIEQVRWRSLAAFKLSLDSSRKQDVELLGTAVDRLGDQESTWPQAKLISLDAQVLAGSWRYEEITADANKRSG